MDSIVQFALQRRLLVLIILIGFLGTGVAALTRLDLETKPGATPMVDIVTQSAGQSAAEIERHITVPIGTEMAGIPEVTVIRTISSPGLSDVRVQFTAGVAYQDAEQWVIYRMSQLLPLPAGAVPQISASTREIYRYRVIGPGYSVADLKTIQDWKLERRFKSVPGVVNVDSDEETKAYVATIDMQKLSVYGLTLRQVLQVLDNSDIAVGGQTVHLGPQTVVVRGVGLVHSVDDIRKSVISSLNGAPILMSDLATVSTGNPREPEIADQSRHGNVVQGIILMRHGPESPPTGELVQLEINNINTSDVLPPGVRIEKIEDRADLINTPMVLRDAIVGAALILTLQWLWLGRTGVRALANRIVIVGGMAAYAYLGTQLT